MSLPELPEPFALSVSVHEGDTPSKTYMECMLYQEHPNEKQRLYTADQMRAYALQAVEAMRREPMTDRMFDLICAAIDKADTITMDADYMLDSDDCIRVVRTMQALIDVCGIAQKEQGK